MKKIYLAGPMFGKTDAECKDWREGVKLALVDLYEFLDPMDWGDIRSGYTPARAEEIIELDKQAIMQADILLVEGTHGASWGTAMEIFYAHGLGKQILTVGPPRISINPWLWFHSNDIFTSWARCISFLVNTVEEESYG